MLPKRFLQTVALAVCACLLALLVNKRTVSQPLPSLGGAAQAAIPTIVQIVDGEEVTLPDWDNITLSSFGSLDVAGSIPDVIDGINLNDALGYEFGRAWEVGASLAQVLKVGDVQGAWTFETLNGLTAPLVGLSLNEIGDLAGVDLFDEIGNLPIRELPFLAEVNAEELLDNLAQVLPTEALNNLADGLEIAGSANQVVGLLDGDITLDDVSELADVALEDFPEIGDAILEEIPFLEEVPLGAIVEFADTLPAIVRFDALYGNPEGYTAFNTISGGFNPPPCDPPQEPIVHCEGGDCPHVETASPGNFSFGRWVSGAAQEVEGGCGFLGGFNGGMEPTGRHPFGNSFKLAVWDIDSVTDTLNTRIFFRICVNPPFSGPTCTPYAIPPQGIPFIPFARDSFGPA